MATYDAIVVGGGPAGTSAARELAAAGFRVCLFEKSTEIGHPVRTSGGSFIDELGKLGIGSHLYHPIAKVTLLGPGEEAAFAYDPPLFCALDVRRLYQELAVDAVRAGAAIQLGSKVVDVSLDGGDVTGVVVRNDRGTDRHAAKLVVDCSGFSAAVVRHAAAGRVARRFGFGAEYEVYAPDCPDDEALLVMGSAALAAGYGWLFPCGGGRVRVGIGVIRPDTDASPQEWLDRFVTSPLLENRLRGAQPIEYHVGYIPSELPRDTFSANGFMAAGDAAGQASTLVGEGIRFAIRSGRIAGRIAAEAIARGDCSTASLGAYDRTWRREFGRMMRIAYRINERMSRSSDADWDERIRLARRLPPELFLEALKGELTLKWLVRAAASAPSLGPRLVRRVLRS